MDEHYLISTKMWRARTLQVFYMRGTPGMSFKEGETMHLLSEKTRLCHIAKRKRRQWKTPTLYTQQLHMHELSK